MTQNSVDNEALIAAIAGALKELVITDRQCEDLKDLYENPRGFAFEVDSRNRPQGRTVDTSRRIGSQLKEMLHLSEKYGMNVVGSSASGIEWRMRDTFRQALKRLDWFEEPSDDELKALDADLVRRLALVHDMTVVEINAKLHDAEARTPARVRVTTLAYLRDECVVYEALRRANGLCARCDKPAPFNRATDGTPYLEVHHIRRLSDGGKDSLSNVEALCPNCHRLKHFGQTRSDDSDA